MLDILPLIINGMCEYYSKKNIRSMFFGYHMSAEMATFSPHKRVKSCRASQIICHYLFFRLILHTQNRTQILNLLF